MASKSPTDAAAEAAGLCVSCGLCCDGTLFKDVELQPRDDAAKLSALGLPLRFPRRSGDSTSTPGEALPKLPQPCAALCADQRCRVYAERPARCREFECALYLRVAGKQLAGDAALRTIRQAREAAEKVKRLLRELGEHDEQSPSSRRFRRVRRRLEAGDLDHATAERYADLTLAVHDLQMFLHREFYPKR